jgi:tetratricopeptide (TPR) repeat protein
MPTTDQTLDIAIGHHQAGRLQQAEKIYQEVLRVDPQYADALHLLGLVWHQQGQHEKGIESIRRALALQPRSVVYLDNLGAAYHSLQRFDDAIECYERALRIDPDNFKTHYDLALAYHSQGRTTAALSSYTSAIKLNPNFLDAYDGLVKIRPNDANARVALGDALQEQGKLKEAEQSYRRAVEIRPDFPEAHNNLGIVLTRQCEFDQAACSLHRALEIKPDFAEAHNNLGYCLHFGGQLDAAVACYQAALSIDPDYADAHNNLGLALLLRGEFEQGWTECEWRWKVKGSQVGAGPLSEPLWDGGPLEKQTILLRAEQGLGDTIQFVRYAQLIRQKASRVIVECPQPLIDLLRSCPGIDELTTQSDKPPTFDFHAPLLSLPRILGTSTGNIPGEVPYLSAREDLVQQWGERLNEDDAFKIGVAWQGNPLHRWDGLRSVSLSQFAQLSEVRGVRLFSLQKGAGTEQLAQAQFPISDCGSEIRDFMDTAAVMMNLDLVITCDSAVAHLAGALGIPVWVALPFTPDWRWLLDREDSPWYPTMRLFRQTKFRDWDGVFQRITAALTESLRADNEPLVTRPLASANIVERTAGSVVRPDAETIAAEIDDVDSLLKKSVALEKAGRWNEAEEACLRALQMRPDSAEAYNRLGVLFKRLGKFEQAIENFRRSLRINSCYAAAHDNLGNALRARGDVDEAIECYRRALQLNPQVPGTYNNLGNALTQQGQLDDAVSSFRSALDIDSSIPTVHMNLGIALLLTGNFKEGFDEYEWRWKTDDQVFNRDFARPLWDGGPLESGSILLHGEQGLGDTLQFVRYAPLVKALGGKVILACDRSLARLLKECNGVDALVSEGDRLPEFNVHASLLSLPRILGTTIESIPDSVPYLDPDTELVDQWRRTLDRVDGLKIGIAWHGSPRHPRNRSRSIPLVEFAPVAGLPDVRLYSLQLGPGREQLSGFQKHFEVTDLADDVHDFMDTAAILMNLDLVITCDTSVAHLAGALGVPVWVAIPFAPDWRWMLVRDDSPWYPTMRLFRQTKLDDWDGVFERIQAELGEMVRQSTQNGDELDQASQCHDTMPQAQHGDRSVADQRADIAATRQNGVEARSAKRHQTAAQYNRLGYESVKKGRLDEAVGYFRQALQLDPDSAGACSNLGNALNDQDRFDEAIECFERAIQIKPDFPDAYNNLGNALRNKGLVDEAIAKCGRAVQLRPDYAVARSNLAFLQLLKGDFASAWSDYAWAWKVKGRPIRNFNQPMWNGSPLNGQTILLYSEQGFGDTLQFIRYAALVGRHGARVVVECPKSLRRLLESCSGIDQITETGAKPPPFDVHASLMRLPELYHTDLDSIPASVPYLSAASDRIEHWRGRVGHLRGSKVGICWQGSTKHVLDRHRSIPLKAFGRLADIADCSLVSLQKGPSSRDLSDVGFSVFDVTSEVRDFMDTAAIMMNLDLVITCDTSVAHLAGALGVPVWVAIPFAPDWRWMLVRDDSPWYPTMRLFRKRTPGDWDCVFERIEAALREYT